MSRFSVGGMTSPAAYPPNGSVRSFSHSPGPMSPPPMGSGGRGILPDGWPHDQVTTSMGRSSPQQHSVDNNEYAKVQAERASLEVQLHSAETRLREAGTRETCLVNQLQRERSQHNQIVMTFLETFRELCPEAPIPQSVPTPEKASALCAQVIGELRNNLQDSDIAVDSARAAVKKVEELTVAVRDRDICIATLEHKISQQRDFDAQKATAVEQQIQILLQTVNSKSDASFAAEPSNRTGDNGDDSLLNWVDTSNTTLPKESPIEPTPQPLMSPARERSPYNSNPRQIKTPAYQPSPVTHGAREGDWPGSPRREDLNETLPEEFPPSPRRQIPEEQGVVPEHAKGWTKHGEEWPPSPRRVDTESYPSPDRLRETSTMEPRNWTSSGEEWPPSPQRVRSSPDRSQNIEQQNQLQPPAVGEWPPSPQRVREPEQAMDSNAVPTGEEWPPSPQRQRGVVEETCPAPTYADENEQKEWPPSPQRQRAPRQEVQPEGTKEWPPSPQRQRAAAPTCEEARKEWPPSPRRERVAHTETYVNGNPAVGDLQTSRDPDTPIQAINVTQTPTSSATEPTATPCDDVSQNTISPQRLEWPATSSPKEKLDRSASGELGDRRRSVGFAGVPENDHHSDIRLTSAMKKIATLEREISSLKGEPPMSQELLQWAERTFAEVDSLCQKDGSISKDELGRVLGEEKLAAKILFHELDENHSGEIDLEEWIHWFERLNRKDGAANMLQWIQERLDTTKKTKKIGFSVDSTVTLDPDVEARIGAAFDVTVGLLEKDGPSTAFFKSHLEERWGPLPHLQENQDGAVRCSEWMAWFEGVQRHGQSADELISWVEAKLQSATDEENLKQTPVSDIPVTPENEE
eukprot:TRINITY_DN824_c3_g1_i1.p1 TRINITY_DN824_c3_g1~~TRINITY_DN824_c3_g1_i1.p1  ORF type:complete len:862 (+),score=200.38 TRINITY_DN824_c3_g1_i1:79-2664(+)